MVTPTETRKIKRLEVEVNHVYSVQLESPYGQGNTAGYLRDVRYQHTYTNQWHINRTYNVQTYHGTITEGRLIREDDTWVDVTPTDSNHRAYWQCTFGHQELPFLLYAQWQNIQGRAIDASLISDWEAMCATFNWQPWDLEFYDKDDQRVYAIQRQGQPLYTFPTAVSYTHLTLPTKA